MTERQPKSYEEAFALYRQRRWTEAAAAFECLAREGNVLAQAALGSMYISGRGVQRDLAAARSWLEKAVALGNPSAKFAVARMRQTEGDHVGAAQLFREAASSGYFPALYWLGLACELGLGRAPSVFNAGSLYGQATEMGHIPSRVRLGRLYMKGYFGQPTRLKGVWLVVSAFALACGLVFRNSTDPRLVR